MEAVEQVAGVAVRVAVRIVALRIVARHVEQRSCDRQWRAQFVRGVGGESPLGDVRFEPREHCVEGIGELTILISAAREPDSVGKRSVRGLARGVRDASQGREHAAGEKPSA